MVRATAAAAVLALLLGCVFFFGGPSDTDIPAQLATPAQAPAVLPARAEDPAGRLSMPPHELASFRREEGRWVYVDGDMNPKGPPRQVAKVGRNEPCPCGSGKKYKKCCAA